MKYFTFLNDTQFHAGYTIEAALLVPLFLFAILRGLLFGIECYEDVSRASYCQEILETIEPTEWIRNEELLKRGGNLIREHTVSEESKE